MKTNKQLYIEHCDIEKNISIFSQAWWLDTVCNNNWDVCLVIKDGEIVASMPYVVKKRYGFTLLSHPQFTQNLGPWLKPSQSKYSKILSQQKQLMQALIKQLPKYDYFNQNWHYSQTNWLPFYWLGFEQTTRYTYVIEDLSDLEKVYSEFEHSKRKDIRKSEKLVQIVFDLSAEEFYENHKMTLAKQGSEISYSFELFKKIYDSGYKNNQAKTIAAFDDKGNLHAALFVVWDEMSAYDLISTIDPDFRTYGAASVLIKEIIGYTAQFVSKFDFEGSMIESVERSFRKFGAIQKPYLTVTHKPSKILSTMLCLKNIFTS
jgi:hypothetical protein